MESTRRAFLGRLTRDAALILLAGGVSYFTGGCNVLSELATWVPIGLQGFSIVLGAINPVAGSALAIAFTTASGLWTALQSAIANYNSTSHAGATGLQKVVAAIDALSGSLDQIVAALPVSIPAAVLVGVKAGLALLISTLNYFAQKYAGTSPAPAARTARMAVYTVPPAPKVGDFKTAFNALKIQRSDGVLVTIQ